MPRTPADVPDAVLRLVLCGDAGPMLHHAVISHFGSAEAASRARARDLAEVGGIPPARARRIETGLALARPDVERAAMERVGASALLLGDQDYPPLLAALPKPPILLWMRGDPEAFAVDAVAVVGARRATPYGEAQSARFASAIASRGLAIVSGGARGIDAAAHRAALRSGGRTVAVVGSGLGQAYPPEHAELFGAIVEAGGAVVSEFPADWPVLPANFPRRNRTIAGLALTVVVVEAGAVSGALITARHALDDHQREPCAVPGPVDSPRSAGCNAAIRDGWAHCVLDPDDVLAALGPSVRPGLPSGAQVQPMA